MGDRNCHDYWYPTKLILVGYGDFYPRTQLGRISTTLCCVYGVVVLSLMLIAVNNMLELSQNEIKISTVT